MTRRPKPWEPAPSDPVAEVAEVQCAEPDCRATTETQAARADQLRGRWRCRDHWRGTCPPPTHAQVHADDTTTDDEPEPNDSNATTRGTLTGEEGRDPS